MGGVAQVQEPDRAHRRRRGRLPGRGRRPEGEGGAQEAGRGEEGDTGVQEISGRKLGSIMGHTD